jgi:hypothetical protein
LIPPSDRNVVFEVLDDNTTTFDLGNWLDKYDKRMDTNKALFSNGYKVPPPVPAPEITMESASRSESSAEEITSESSGHSSAAVHESRAPISGASQRPPRSAWNAKVRVLNAKVAEILSQSYLTPFNSGTKPLMTHSGNWHSSKKAPGNTAVYDSVGRPSSLASSGRLEVFRHPSFHSSF